MRRRFALLIALVLAAAGTPAIALPVIGGSTVAGTAGDLLGICDPIDPAACLLPFPSDFFTVDDPTMDTGRRVHFNALAMPTNVLGKPIDPTEWNRNDGFSPGSPIFTRVPGLDLHATWETKTDQITDLSRSLRADAPIVLLDATTGERHPFWSELDQHPATPDDKRLLIVRPAKNLTEGHRYVIGLRRLRDSGGRVLEPNAAFRAIREGAPAPVIAPQVEARRAGIGRALADLEQAGVGRADMYLAWDFTVASERNLSERVLAMRDDAFARLGDTRLADGVIQGVAPSFTIDQVEDFTPAQNRGTARRIKGLLTVPNYLTPQVIAKVEVPEELRGPLNDLRDQIPEPPSPIDTVTGLVDDSFEMAVPGSRLVYGSNGLPMQDPAQPTIEVPFDCHLPHPSATAARGGQADGIIYGHGLLGSRGEAGGGSTEDLRLRGFAICATDWMGMASQDLGSVAAALVDISNFPAFIDRVQQGFINKLYLARVLAHPTGLASHSAFRNGAGQPVLRTGKVFYDGNSQGGIMGGALTALAPDFTTAKLGVVGMNYSLLLNRSVDWEGSYAVVAYAAYPDPIDHHLFFGLTQMLWDRGESNGYAHHMTDDPLPNSPVHQVMLQVAYADHQVSNMSAEVEARTIGARLKSPGLGSASPHWSIDPGFGLPPAQYGRQSVGQSALVYWYSDGNGNKPLPTGNVPPEAGRDPHEDPRRDNAGSDQVAHFLRTGELIDVCRGGPCVTTDASRKN